LTEIIQDFVLLSLNESALELLASNKVVILFLECRGCRLMCQAILFGAEQLRALLCLTAATAFAGTRSV
jgi:hypothetical protein